MLITFVVAYLAVTITIGLIAARRVKNSKDYLVAGRSLPLYMNVATVFATWFGAETVLAVSATFAMDGLNGIPGDPFGASVCLVLAALLFARLFYRMNLLTIGDFYKRRFGKHVEVLVSGSIVMSYLGWTSAQITALGLMAIDPIGKAVAPRFWAALICMPLLTGFFCSLAISAGYFEAVHVIGIDQGFFWQVLKDSVDFGDDFRFRCVADQQRRWARAAGHEHVAPILLEHAGGEIVQEIIRQLGVRGGQTERDRAVAERFAELFERHLHADTVAHTAREVR